MLNMKQVEILFGQEAVLIGERNGVPSDRVKELFGEAATDYAFHLKNGSCTMYHSLFGTGTFQCEYVTIYGFMQAASYANVKEIEKASIIRPVQSGPLQQDPLSEEVQALGHFRSASVHP